MDRPRRLSGTQYAGEEVASSAVLPCMGGLLWLYGAVSRATGHMYLGAK
jgi:hypothetical protein